MKELGHPMEREAVQAVFDEYDLDRCAGSACRLSSCMPHCLAQKSFITWLPDMRLQCGWQERKDRVRGEAFWIAYQSGVVAGL